MFKTVLSFCAVMKSTDVLFTTLSIKTETSVWHLKDIYLPVNDIGKCGETGLHDRLVRTIAAMLSSISTSSSPGLLSLSSTSMLGPRCLL